MTGVALPVLGLGIIVGIVLPAAALGARGGLWLLDRTRGPTLERFNSVRYLLLVGPTVFPLLWFLSACLRQVVVGTEASVCVVPDPPGRPCPEVAALGVLLVVLIAGTALPHLLRERRAPRGSDTSTSAAVRRRIERLAHGQPDLGPLLRRLVIADDAPEAIATRGFLRPRVVIDARFAAELDDEALLAALQHEAGHTRAADPLRYLFAQWAVSLNPVGRRLLGADLRRWILAREAHCDRDAVLRGASAPALAHALVRAARFPVTSCGVALGATDADVLRLRVALLLAYAERPPRPWPSVPMLPGVLVGIAVALLVPHRVDDGALDTLHRATERVLALVTTG